MAEYLLDSCVFEFAAPLMHVKPLSQEFNAGWRLVLFFHLQQCMGFLELNYK